MAPGHCPSVPKHMWHLEHVLRGGTTVQLLQLTRQQISSVPAALPEPDPAPRTLEGTRASSREKASVWVRGLEWKVSLLLPGRSNMQNRGDL